jgi:hypothetical protein
LAAETVALDFHVNQGEMGGLTDDGRRQKDGAGACPPDLHTSLTGEADAPIDFEYTYQSGKTGTFTSGRISPAKYPNWAAALDAPVRDAKTVQVIQCSTTSLEIQDTDHLPSPIGKSLVSGMARLQPGWRPPPSSFEDLAGVVK